MKEFWPKGANGNVIDNRHLLTVNTILDQTSCVGALDNQIPIHFSQSGHDMEKESAHRQACSPSL